MHNSHNLESIFITAFKLISTNFLLEKYIYVQNKHKGNKTKTNKVYDTKTIESIKYEPILS